MSSRWFSLQFLSLPESSACVESIQLGKDVTLYRVFLEEYLKGQMSSM